MTTYFDIHCIPCDEPAGFESIRCHTAREILALRDVIAPLAGTGLDVRLYGVTDVSADWFAKHAGHPMQIRDEYGEVYTEEGEKV